MWEYVLLGVLGVTILVVLIVLIVKREDKNCQKQPVPRTMVLGGNSGQCPCNKFCGKDWGGNLHKAGWVGAKAIGSYKTNDPQKNNLTPYVPADPEGKSNISCVCQEDPSSPFMPDGQFNGDCNADTAWAFGNDGSVSCADYCNKNTNNWIQNTAPNSNVGSWGGSSSNAGMMGDGTVVTPGNKIVGAGNPISCACANTPSAPWAIFQ